MLSRPRSLLFWLVVIILLYVIATAPTELAHFILSTWRGTKEFFNALDILIDTLETS
ncbi:hypothetical protein ACFVGN_12630 [Streptomyces sp. NPDC057757]|uniref:hypothetical protein n=1 Tax=Streptomyces sp. NPDC057757 TaxID=3346241 RepID=UPI003684309C